MGDSGIKALVLILAVFISETSWSGQVIEPLKEALQLHETGKIKEAIVHYDRFIKTHPKRIEGYFNRGNAYRRLKQERAALDDYSAAIKLNPQDGRAYINRGSIHFDARRYD